MYNTFIIFFTSFLPVSYINFIKRVDYFFSVLQIFKTYSMSCTVSLPLIMSITDCGVIVISHIVFLTFQSRSVFTIVEYTTILVEIEIAYIGVMQIGEEFIFN